MTTREASSPVLLLLVGLGFLGAGAYLGSRSRALVDVGEVAEGTVIAMKPVRPNEIDSSYGPVVRFRVRSGVEHSFESGQGAKPPAFHVGERVEVLHDPRHPEDAMVRTFFQLWGMPLILGATGIALVLGWLLLVRAAHRRASMRSQ